MRGFKRELKQYKNNAKSILLDKGYWGELLLSNIIVWGVCGFPIIGIIVGFIVGGPLSLGLCQSYYDAVHGKKVNQLNLLSKFKTQFGASFLLNLLIPVFYSVVLGVIALPLGLVWIILSYVFAALNLNILSIVVTLLILLIGVYIELSIV